MLSMLAMAASRSLPMVNADGSSNRRSEAGAGEGVPGTFWAAAGAGAGAAGAAGVWAGAGAGAGVEGAALLEDAFCVFGCRNC